MAAIKSKVATDSSGKTHIVASGSKAEAKYASQGATFSSNAATVRSAKDASKAATSARNASDPLTVAENAGATIPGRIEASEMPGVVAGLPGAAPTGAPTDPLTTASGSPAQPGVGTGVVAYDQAQKNLAAGGLSGGALSAAQGSLGNAYGQGHAQMKASGTPVSQEAGIGLAAARSNVQTQPDTTKLDSTLAAAPNINDVFSQLANEILNPQKQTSTLMQDYKKLYKDSGLDSINEQIIDADTIINGTEDNIRNEIQTAGGLGTDSQVQAMALARNKGLLVKYNQLVQMKTDATNQLNTMSQLNAQDKQMAQTQMNARIGNMFQLANFQQQATNNIKEAARWNLENNPLGYYNALSQDPTRLAQTEQLLGMAKGGLQSTATSMSQNLSLDKQLKIAQINSANRANQPDGVGGGVINPKYSGVLQTILGSGKFTANQAAQITNAINSGDDPLSVVRNQAKNIMGQTAATDVTQYETARSAVGDLSSAIAEFYANGGDTGVFTGNYEKTINKLGSVTDPALVDLAVQIQSQLQVYRNAVSGTAYGIQEGAAIDSIFPGINKSEGLNQAIISGRMKAFDSTINGYYESTLGKNTYQSVVGGSGGKGSQSNADFVENTLSNSGISYDKAVSNAPQGKVPVIDNNTGKLGYILPGEYNSSMYTRV